MWSCPGNMPKYYPGQRDILPDRRQDHINIIIILTVYNRTVFKNGSYCTVRLGNVSCLQKFQHFWMIIRDLFFESGSTEAAKIKKKHCKGMSFIFLIK